MTTLTDKLYMLSAVALSYARQCRTMSNKHLVKCMLSYINRSLKVHCDGLQEGERRVCHWRSRSSTGSEGCPATLAKCHRIRQTKWPDRRVPLATNRPLCNASAQTTHPKCRFEDSSATGKTQLYSERLRELTSAGKK